jgi:hypothetical protein
MKKLVLNKNVVVKLTEDESNKIRGGTDTNSSPECCIPHTAFIWCDTPKTDPPGTTFEPSCDTYMC